MFDFIPIGQYTNVFNYSVLILTLIVFFQCQRGVVFRKDVVNLNAGWGLLVTVLLVFYMGLRPISGDYFGDTGNYAYGLQRFVDVPFYWHRDTEWLFLNVMHWFARNSTAHAFFLFCSFLYVIPLWGATRRIYKSYYYIPFIVLLGMFTFWSFGVNGIRNGIGASFFILALSYVDNIPLMILWCVIGVGFHKSVIMMIGAAFLTWFIKNSFLYLIVWLSSIPISYLFGMRIQLYIASLDILGGEDKFSGYLTGENQIGEIVQMSMSFRWDFLLYSAMGVAVGYYFIFIRKFKDEYYHWLFNTFLVLNTFWVLVIRATYTNRLAQVSWFVMPIILIYPFLRKRFWLNHEKMLGYALLAFYAFAFYYNIVR